MSIGYGAAVLGDGGNSNGGHLPRFGLWKVPVGNDASGKNPSGSADLYPDLNTFLALPGIAISHLLLLSEFKPTSV